MEEYKYVNCDLAVDIAQKAIKENVRQFIVCIWEAKPSPSGEGFRSTP